MFLNTLKLMISKNYEINEMRTQLVKNYGIQPKQYVNRNLYINAYIKKEKP